MSDDKELDEWLPTSKGDRWHISEERLKLAERLAVSGIDPDWLFEHKTELITHAPALLFELARAVRRWDWEYNCLLDRATELSMERADLADEKAKLEKKLTKDAK